MKWLKKIKFNNWFNRLFGFEHGIDISDETQVLFRRNIVIKNIIFISNILFTVLMTVLSLITGHGSNWVVTILLFPVTFLINNTINKMIYRKENDLVYQQIAMYFAVFYMFFLSFLIYMKMKTSVASEGGEAIFGEAGYILIYYSLVVASLYQDKRMVKNTCKWVVAAVTILHFTITYPLVDQQFVGNNIFEKIWNFISTPEFVDVILRTVILIVFMIVLYVIVSISQYMQDERRKELLKRQKVEEDFTKVVTDMFNITLNNNQLTEDDKKHIELVSVMSEKFGEILGLEIKETDEIRTFARIHIDKKVDLNVSDIQDKDLQYEHLKNQTSLGNLIVKRLELERRCDNIIRSHEEGYTDGTNIDGVRNSKMTEHEQIILICDMYISLRSVRSYKRPLPHKISIDIMGKEFSGYYDGYIFERFMRFQDEFEKIYDEF